MTTTTTTPRVWIGCLAAYNNGKLHGEWVDAAVEEDEIWAAQQRVLRTSPEPGAEEHFIADHEGFGPYRVGEYDSLAEVARVARLIEEHGVAFAAWLSNGGSHADAGEDEDVLEEAFQEEYQGEWESEKEFAENLVDELGLPGVGYVFPERPEWGPRSERPSWSDVLSDMGYYLDWEAITRSVMEGYWTHEEDGKTHVFSSE